MIRNRTIVSALLATILTAAAATAQAVPEPVAAPRFHAGVSLAGLAPRGEYGDQIDGALGFGGNLRYQLDQERHFAIRLDANWLIHGLDETEVDLRSPLGGTQSVDLITTNSVAFLGVGPELTASLGRAQPYLSASVGPAIFVTDAQGDREEDGVRLRTSVQHNDVALGYAGQAGVRLPVSAGPRSVSIDVGARYQHSGDAEYLRKGDLVVDDSGAISLNTVRTQTDAWVVYAGVSVPVMRKGKSE